MAADAQPHEAQSNDLFGRWLAHHEQQAAEPGAARDVDDITAESSPPPRASSRRLPTAAVASAAVQGDPMIGSRIVPPSNFGSRRRPANSPQPSGPVSELDREPPPGWEPIVMRSVRKKVEEAEAKQAPKPAERRGRLQRLKARLVDPPEAEAEALVEVPEVPLTPPIPRSTTPLPAAAPAPLPRRTPAAVPPAARSIEDTIRSAVPSIEPQVARHAEPRIEPRVEPRVEAPPVVARVEPVHEVAPVAYAATARHAEPEDVAPPPLVRGFVGAMPHFVDPDPEPEPVRAPYVEPQVEAYVEAYVEPAVVETAPEPVAYVPEPVDYAPEPVAYVREPVAAPEPVTYAPEPVAYVPEPVVAPEPVTYAPEPVVAPEPVTYVPEPVIAPEPEPEPDPEPVFVAEPEPEPAPEPVSFVEPEPSLFEEPEEPDETPEATPDETPPAAPARSTGRQFFLSRPKRQPKEPKAHRDRRQSGRQSGRQARAHAGDAARDLVAAKARARARIPGPAPVPAPEPVPMIPVAVEAPAEPAPPTRPVSRHDEVATEMPGIYKFAPRRNSRRLLTIALLIGLVLSAYFGRIALQVKDTQSAGLAAIVLLATAMVWAIRAGASVTKLQVHQGHLQVTQQGSRYVFDLASQYTRFEVHGEPGHRGWKVLFPRRGMAPFAVDATMVDPDDFMRVLRFFRPQLVHH